MRRLIPSRYARHACWPTADSADTGSCHISLLLEIHEARIVLDIEVIREVVLRQSSRIHGSDVLKPDCGRMIAPICVEALSFAALRPIPYRPRAHGRGHHQRADVMQRPGLGGDCDQAMQAGLQTWAHTPTLGR